MQKSKRISCKLLVYGIVFAMGGMAASCLAVWKADDVQRVVSEYREKARREQESRFMHEKKVDLSSYDPLQDEEDAWYTRYHFIAHAGGVMDGKYYTNSREAWEDSYAKGNRVFDADLNFTSDGQLVLRHEWSDELEQNGGSINNAVMYIDDNGQVNYHREAEIPSFPEFMESPIYYKYTPMTAEDMISFMTDHEDIYVALDFKGDAGAIYRELLSKIRSLGHEDILERFIVNFYKEEDYDTIMNLYAFQNVTARQHYGRAYNYYDLAEFCLKNDIHVVNLSACYMEDAGVQVLKEKGIHIYVAVVDYISQMKEYHDLYGADGAVTNWLYEDDWKYIED